MVEVEKGIVRLQDVRQLSIYSELAWMRRHDAQELRL
jgi:hypothetical protein